MLLHLHSHPSHQNQPLPPRCQHVAQRWLPALRLGSLQLQRRASRAAAAAPDMPGPVMHARSTTASADAGMRGARTPCARSPVPRPRPLPAPVRRPQSCPSHGCMRAGPAARRRVAAAGRLHALPTVPTLLPAAWPSAAPAWPLAAPAISSLGAALGPFSPPRRANSIARARSAGCSSCDCDRRCYGISGRASRGGAPRYLVSRRAAFSRAVQQ